MRNRMKHALFPINYALRKQNRILFEEMLDRCKKKDYVDCAAYKGENFSAEALFLVLIIERQKMINELIQKFGKVDRI
jgi:hypothetical protein